MRAGVFRSIGRKGMARGVVVAEAARPVPDGELTLDVPTDGHTEPRTRGTAGLLGDLEREGVESDDVVLADRALFLLAQDRVEVDAVQRHEGDGGVGGRPRKLCVV